MEKIIYAKKMGEFIRAERGSVDRLIIRNVIADEFANGFTVSCDGIIKINGGQ